MCEVKERLDIRRETLLTEVKVSKEDGAHQPDSCRKRSIKETNRETSSIKESTPEIRRPVVFIAGRLLDSTTDLSTGHTTT